MTRGHRHDFESWLDALMQRSQKLAGYRGMFIKKDLHQEGSYRVSCCFDQIGNALAWRSDPMVVTHMALVSDILEAAPLMEIESDNYFYLPDRQIVPVPVPPKWKMTVVTWGASFPLIYLLNIAVPFFIAGIDPLAEMVLSSVVLITILTFFVMPWTLQLFAAWLSTAEPKGKIEHTVVG